MSITINNGGTTTKEETTKNGTKKTKSKSDVEIKVVDRRGKEKVIYDSKGKKASKRNKTIRAFDIFKSNLGL